MERYTLQVDAVKLRIKVSEKSIDLFDGQHRQFYLLCFQDSHQKADSTLSN